MSNRKTAMVTPLPIDAAPLFILSQDIVDLAQNVFASDADLYIAEVRFHRALFTEFAPSDLFPTVDGKKRGDNLQRAFEFVQSAYLISQVGKDCVAQLNDAAIKGATIIQPPANCRFNRPQPKRNLKNTILGSKVWGVWLKGQAQLAIDLASSDSVVAAEKVATEATKALRAAQSAERKAKKEAKVANDPEIATQATMATELARQQANDARLALADKVQANIVKRAKAQTRNSTPNSARIAKGLHAAIAVMMAIVTKPEKDDGSYSLDKIAVFMPALKDLMKANGIK